MISLLDSKVPEEGTASGAEHEPVVVVFVAVVISGSSLLTISVLVLGVAAVWRSDPDVVKIDGTDSATTIVVVAIVVVVGEACAVIESEHGFDGDDSAGINIGGGGDSLMVCSCSGLDGFVAVESAMDETTTWGAVVVSMVVVGADASAFVLVDDDPRGGGTEGAGGGTDEEDDNGAGASTGFGACGSGGAETTVRGAGADDDCCCDCCGCCNGG